MEFAGAWGGTEVYPIETFVELLKEYHALGCECIILTARTPSEHNKYEIEYFLKKCDVAHCISDIHFTYNQPKGPFAHKLGVHLHYDDSMVHLISVAQHGIRVVNSLKAEARANPKLDIGDKFDGLRDFIQMTYSN